MQIGGEAWMGCRAGRVPEDTDQVLAHAAAGGDRCAFEALVQRHYGRVRSVCGRLLSDADEVDDVVQETFVRALQHVGRLRSETSVRAWLVRIAINACKNRYRLFWRRRVTLTDVLADLELPGRDAYVLAERSAFREALERAVQELPERLRLPFMLHALEELTGPEIAAALGWNESTVWTRIYTARRRLRQKLAAFLDEAV